MGNVYQRLAKHSRAIRLTLLHANKPGVIKMLLGCDHAALEEDKLTRVLMNQGVASNMIIHASRSDGLST